MASGIRAMKVLDCAELNRDGCHGLMYFDIVPTLPVTRYIYVVTYSSALRQGAGTAYAHVRTEPLARHRPNSRKKNVVGPFELLVSPMHG